MGSLIYRMHNLLVDTSAVLFFVSEVIFSRISLEICLSRSKNRYHMCQFKKNLVFTAMSYLNPSAPCYLTTAVDIETENKITVLCMELGSIYTNTIFGFDQENLQQSYK